MESVEEIFDDANGDLAVGELESAVEKYRRCVELDPQFFDGWHALGMALMKLGRFPEAIEAGKKTVELKPNDQIATETSRKPKPPGQRRKFSPGVERSPRSRSDVVPSGESEPRAPVELLSSFATGPLDFARDDGACAYFPTQR